MRDWRARIREAVASLAVMVLAALLLFLTGCGSLPGKVAERRMEANVQARIGQGQTAARESVHRFRAKQSDSILVKPVMYELEKQEVSAIEDDTVVVKSSAKQQVCPVCGEEDCQCKDCKCKSPGECKLPATAEVSPVKSANPPPASVVPVALVAPARVSPAAPGLPPAPRPLNDRGSWWWYPDIKQWRWVEMKPINGYGPPPSYFSNTVCGPMGCSTCGPNGCSPPARRRWGR